MKFLTNQKIRDEFCEKNSIDKYMMEAIISHYYTTLVANMQSGVSCRFKLTGLGYIESKPKILLKELTVREEMLAKLKGGDFDSEKAIAKVEFSINAIKSILDKLAEETKRKEEFKIRKHELIKNLEKQKSDSGGDPE